MNLLSLRIKSIHFISWWVVASVWDYNSVPHMKKTYPNLHFLKTTNTYPSIPSQWPIPHSSIIGDISYGTYIWWISMHTLCKVDIHGQKGYGVFGELRRYCTILIFIDVWETFCERLKYNYL